MLSQEDNEKLSRVGPGTPMGRLMRKYWTPALLSSELQPDASPVRVKLLGEALIAFRDTSGKVGLLDEYCAHRRVSLFLGRNEEDGLRCVYHGWKYDVNGRCVDMPTEPEDSPYKHKIKLTAYPVVELGGVVWAYLGEGEPPAAPQFEWAMLPPEKLQISRTWEECNWLQSLEGGIDSAHASALHKVLTEKTNRPGLRGLWTKPVFMRDEVVLTSYGHCYTSLRPIDEKTSWAKVYHFVMPFTTCFPFELPDGKNYQPWLNGHIFVPMDDENTMVYNWIGKYGDATFTAQERLEMETSRGRGTNDIGPGFRKVRNIDVNWLIDRSVQKTETYSGIEGINNQDHAVQESMGPIVDRTKEHLGSTDAAVRATRRLLLRCLKSIDAGTPPPGVLPTYYGVRAVEKVIEKGGSWHRLLDGFINDEDAKAVASGKREL